MSNFICEFCKSEQDTLYEGYFRTDAYFNVFAKGTASAGLLQLRRACYSCTEKAIENGYCCAKSLTGAKND